jgi:hypothetical protein
MPNHAEPDATLRGESSVPPTHSEDGVDLTLIRWMLSLTPAQRLDVLEDHLSTVLRMRGEAAHS